MYARILVPTDGSTCSDEAVTHGVSIARSMGAEIVFLFVMDTLRTWREGVVNMEEALQLLTAQGRTITDRAKAKAAEARVFAEAELLEGEPAEVIVRRSTDFHLVILGSHGKRLMQRLTLGSVTESVLHKIARPLLVVPAPR